jgi:hypothetical protein
MSHHDRPSNHCGAPRRHTPCVADLIELHPSFSDQTIDILAIEDVDADDVIVELAHLRADNERLTAELHTTRERNDKLERRLNTLLANRTSNRLDLATVDDAVHSTLADQFRNIVEQDMQHLVRDHLRLHHARSGPSAVAAAISALCRELLSEQRSPDPATTCLRLGMDPTNHVRMLQDIGIKLEQLQRPGNVVWDFQAQPGTLLDHPVQQPWGQCDPALPIQFIVAPGYRANGKIFAKQQVFTSAERSSWLQGHRNKH